MKPRPETGFKKRPKTGPLQGLSQTGIVKETNGSAHFSSGANKIHTAVDKTEHRGLRWMRVKAFPHNQPAAGGVTSCLQQVEGGLAMMQHKDQKHCVKCSRFEGQCSLLAVDKRNWSTAAHRRYVGQHHLFCQPPANLFSNITFAASQVQHPAARNPWRNSIKFGTRAALEQILNDESSA